jgi:type I restriction enzyme, S subunit
MVTDTLIPKGYRKADVGVIPDDWEVKFLSELFTFSGGFTASREELSDDGFCYLHYGDIHKSNKIYIDVSEEYSAIPKLNISINFIPKKSLLDDGDIVFVDASEDDEGASKHIVVRNLKRINYISGLHTIVSKSKDRSLDNTYKQFCFQTRDIKRQFKFYAVGTKVTGISKTNIAKIQIPVPPLLQQTAIATALSDADALISSLEKLIAKKRNIKQGAMQELLTGKKRLPGFSGEWEVKKLGEIAEINMGQSPDSKNYNSRQIGVPLIQGNADIENRKSIKRIWTTQITKTCDEGDLIMTVRAPVGAIGIASENSCIGRGVCSLKPKNSYRNFLYHLLIYNEDKWKIVEQGSTFTSANSSQILNFQLSIVNSIAEQTAIAHILSDMDAEIEQLEQKLAKYRQIKQGMMQELLTGKTRLI